jgi:hypothetical protein
MDDDFALEFDRGSAHIASTSAGLPLRFGARHDPLRYDLLTPRSGSGTSRLRRDVTDSR